YMIASDIHPLIAFRAISFLRDGFKIDTSGRREWFNYWLIEGLDALELWLSADGGARRYCVGDQVTIADVCLVPQLEVARRNHIDLGDFPRLTSVEATCIALDAFRKAQPATQAKSS
ncbi:MAG: glutathione binding-like protein, partial [Gammaproteobacteria bacterium]|nr:glutathione binding-like protein [Gammaproteobacteria bacterium]